MRPGDGYLIHHSRSFDTAFPVGGKIIPLRIKSAALGALVRHPETAAGRSFDGAHPNMALLRGYLSAFTGVKDSLSTEMLGTFGLHIVDLVASVIGATRDGAAQADDRGIKAARLRAALAAISTRSTDPTFTVNALGAELKVTSRYIQLLLEETGTTFSGHVVEHRLQRAWRLLSDPFCRLKIAAVAYECGFNDLSTFNRAFRRRFGETPTAVRGANTIPPPGNRAAGEPTLVEHLARTPAAARRAYDIARSGATSRLPLGRIRSESPRDGHVLPPPLLYRSSRASSKCMPS